MNWLTILTTYAMSGMINKFSHKPLILDLLHFWALLITSNPMILLYRDSSGFATQSTHLLKKVKDIFIMLKINYMEITMLGIATNK